MIVKGVYNVSRFHPLSKYPGPFVWRLSRLPASYAHASGTLYEKIAAIHEQYGETVRIAPDELSFTAPQAWAQIYNARPQLEKTKFHCKLQTVTASWIPWSPHSLLAIFMWCETGADAFLSIAIVGRSDVQGFAESMITSGDNEHMRLRRLANPAFLNSGVLEV